MRTLIAVPDRDLARCCESLLAESLAVFDGAQALTALETGLYDLCVMSWDLPRIGWQRIAALCREKEILTLALIPGPVSAALLLDPAAACGYLPLPFLPEDLTGAVRDLREKAGMTLPFDGFMAQGFTLRTAGGTRPLTAGELDLLAALHGERRADAPLACVSALNAKLPGYRIRYRKNEGYRLVTEHA